MDFSNEVPKAVRRIRRHVRVTPLEYSPVLSEKLAAEVYLKLENQQLTGSFKIRGATNKLLCLRPSDRARGVVAASSGNHAAAVARTARMLGCEATVFVPENCSRAKVHAIRQLGARLRFHGEDVGDTETYARQWALDRGQALAAPYNDADVIMGQGTIAHELLAQGMSPDAVFAPVGGGGLISGIAGYLKATTPASRVFGCQPRHSAIMHLSVQAGRVVDRVSKATLSDGTAGGIEPGSITFSVCQRDVDEFVLVTEREIASAIRLILDHHHQVIEGAAAVAVAASLKRKRQLAGQRVVVVISGGNLATETLLEVLNRGT